MRIACITATHPDDYRNLPPLAFGYLSAFIKREIEDAEFVISDDADAAMDFEPDLVMISSTTVNFGIATFIANKIKSLSQAPVIAGGVHISLMPGTLPDEMDIGVIGEGEKTALELIKLLKECGKFSQEALSGIRGVCYHQGGAVCVNEKRGLIKNLDSLPHPDRRLLKISQERTHIMASRGCPFDCAFCSSKAFWGGYRAHGAKWILDEIEDLAANHGVKEIHFFDDLMMADKDRFRAIAEGIAEMTICDSVSFSMALRAEQADRELFELMTKMGVTQITFGAESNSGKILNYLKGGRAAPSENQKLVDLANEFEIGVGPSFIKGTPGETGDDLLATYSFLLDNIRAKKINYFEMHTLTPYPGTKIWDTARQRGLVSDSMDWNELRYPWERQYMNHAMPKASFYFFETLTGQANKMIGIFDYKLVCIIDSMGDYEQVERIFKQLKHNVFYNEVIAVDSGPEHDISGLIDDLLVQFEGGDNKVFFCYCVANEDFDPDSLIGATWHAFNEKADFVCHGLWRNYMPATDFDASIRVFSYEGLKQAADSDFYKFIASVSDRADTKPGLKHEIYRPDFDPFVFKSATERLFLGNLGEDFKVEKKKKERLKRAAAVEGRIMEKSHTLSGMERKKRAQRSGSDNITSIVFDWLKKKLQ